MNNIMAVIANETKGKSFKTFKYSFESTHMPSFAYDYRQNITWKQYGETRRFEKYIDLTEFAKKIQNETPCFSYFLDGSRRAFKVDDISYRNKVYPVIAGQIGIGCCTRNEKKMSSHKFTSRFAIALPKVASTDDWESKLFFNTLLLKVNKIKRLTDISFQFTDILSYSNKIDEAEKMENKGIAVIQNLMIENEQKMVAEIAKANLLNHENYLLKDGSLEYRILGKDINKNKNALNSFKSNFQWVVGASKSFNPENCKDNKGKNNSNIIADLKLFHRTPVSMYNSESIGNISFAVWYVRIRQKNHTSSAFDGILKLEKILVTDKQMESGVDSEEIDLITANIINERNPVCYGDDFRWANHLYPVYVTEKYVKSKYLSNSMFLNLF